MMASPEHMHPDEEPELGLDDVRDFLYTAVRASERFTDNLRKLVEELDKRKPDEEWLEQTQEEAGKGLVFHEGQLRAWTAFSERVLEYVDSVRREADELAIQELQLNGESVNEEQTPQRARRKKQSRTIHPELLKFKLEKQAKILGKYGGSPALGAGLVLPRMPRDAILKATGSPAAREIQYSKAEEKDARYLANVMQFKVQKKDEELSPWLAETQSRKGKDYFNEEARPKATTNVHTPYALELSGRLQQRQAALAAAEEEAGKPQRPDPATPNVTSATSELADKLVHRQSVLQAQAKAEAAAAAAAKAAAEEPEPPSTDWSNTAAPFGQELSKALQRRQQQQQQVEEQSAVATPDRGPAAATASRQQQGVTPAASTAGAGRSYGTPSQATPASGYKRTPAGQTPSIPSIAATAGGNAASELAEKLRRRQALAEQAAESSTPNK